MTLTAVDAEIPVDEDEEVSHSESYEPSDKVLICESCDKEFIHDKRGRKPKRCAECRGNVKSSAATSGTRRNSSANLQAQLEGLYALAALAVSTKNPGDAALIAESGPSLAKGWADWAAVNPKVKKTLERMITTTAAGAVIGGHAMLAMKIAANHKAQAAAHNGDA